MKSLIAKTDIIISGNGHKLEYYIYQHYGSLAKSTVRDAYNQALFIRDTLDDITRNQLTFEDD